VGRAAVGVDRRLLRLAAYFAAICASLSGAAAAQITPPESSAVLGGSVTERERGLALGYSVVAIPALGSLGSERYTSADGRFVFSGLPPGTYRLRVKRLGYSPREVELRLGPGRTDVVVELTRVALRLDAVRVVARSECLSPGPPDPYLASQFAILFDQVRQNAERYRLLRDRYPYQYTVERTFTDSLRNGQMRRLSTDTVAFASDAGWRYAPGRMISPIDLQAGERVLVLPTLADVVDSAFLANHCFDYAGLDTIGGTTLIRVDFRAAKRLRTPDVDGSVYLDTATYQIRGARVQLSRVPTWLRGVRALTARTLFEEVVPSIPIPSHVTGTTTFRPRSGALAPVLGVETQVLIKVLFKGEIPGDVPTDKPPRGA